MYTSTCNIDTDQLADLMCGAHLLGMKKLFNETVRWILTDPLHPEAVNLCNQFGTSIPSEIGTSIPSEITTYIADYCAWWEQIVARWNLEAEQRRQKKRLEMDPVAREALAALSSSESDDEGN